jgi:TatD DNase family protein
MTLTDTHTHLYAPEFDADRDTLIAEAIDKGVTRFFLPNIDETSVEAMTALESKYPEHCHALMGLHPCSVGAHWEKDLAAVEARFTQRTYAGVGEIGMDLYWDKTYVTEQEEVLRRQLRLAHRHRLPVVLHSRDSFEEIYRILLDENKHLENPQQPLRGIFHCFTGTPDQAERAIGLGFFLGIGGVVTFKNSGLDKVVAGVGLQHLVLETDAPYLAPAPFRGKRNVPSYLLLVAEKLADIFRLPLEEVAAVTTENSRTIFGR